MTTPAYETMVFLHLSYACVFECVYCHRHEPEVPHPLDVDRIVGRLDRLGKPLLVCLCGGEPFYVPNFVELVVALSRRHLVRIDTNLAVTRTCRRFLEEVDPSRIAEIVFSTHVLEREKRHMPIEDLIRLVKEFQARGFPIVGNYVAYPPLFGRLEEDIRGFASHGIRVLPNFFVGRYDGRIYPEENGRLTYTPEQVELVTRLNPLAKLRLHSPKGETCNAGCSAFCVNEKWEVYPCLNIKDRKLGDFFGEWKTFPKTIVCPKERCGDQYNKAFACTLGERTDLAALYRRTLEREGSHTEAETRRLMGDTAARRVRKFLELKARGLARRLLR